MGEKSNLNIIAVNFTEYMQVFDGHGGKDAAHYIRDNVPRVTVEDADFPLELEKVVRRSFVHTDSQFAEKCSHHDALSSGTTALTPMIFGRSLLVANAGDCRAVLSRRGAAIEMSKDHRTCLTCGITHFFANRPAEIRWDCFFITKSKVHFKPCTCRGGSNQILTCKSLNLAP